MVLLYLTYIYIYIIDGIITQNGILIGGKINSPAFPFRFVLYSVLVISFVYLFVMSQTRRLVKIRKLLREKEQALDLIEIQKGELELRDKNITDSLIYAQRIQEALLPSETYFRKHFEDSFI